MEIRPAQASDADGIAAVQGAAALAAYGDWLPADVKARYEPAARRALWRALLAREADAPLVLVAQRAGDPAVSGFVWLRRIEEAGAAFDGEIVAIYVEPARQGEGLGRRLMAAAAAVLADRGAGSVYLWVYRRQRAARRFYERLGGRIVDADVETLGGVTLATMAYAWRPLDGLIAACRPEGGTRR